MSSFLTLLTAVLDRKCAILSAMSLLRALIPSWKFFDELGASVHLRFRTAWSLDRWDSWQEVSSFSINSKTARTERPWWKLFINASENLRLAELSLVERLAFDLSSMQVPELSGLKSHLSYKLVESWIRSELDLRSSENSVRYFQFELIIDHSAPSATEKTEEHYFSEVHSFK